MGIGYKHRQVQPLVRQRFAELTDQLGTRWMAVGRESLHGVEFRQECALAVREQAVEAIGLRGREVAAFSGRDVGSHQLDGIDLASFEYEAHRFRHNPDSMS